MRCDDKRCDDKRRDAMATTRDARATRCDDHTRRTRDPAARRAGGERRVRVTSADDRWDWPGPSLPVSSTDDRWMSVDAALPRALPAAPPPASGTARGAGGEREQGPVDPTPVSDTEDALPPVWPTCVTSAAPARTHLTRAADPAK
eukprot:gene6103-10357_t